jgi:hypothetical protein
MDSQFTLIVVHNTTIREIKCVNLINLTIPSPHKGNPTMAISKSPAMPQEKGSSAKQNTSVGSGSRPGTTGKYPLASSAPKDPYGLDGRNKTPNKPL